MMENQTSDSGPDSEEISLQDIVESSLEIPLLIVGSILNILVVMVMARKKLRKSSASVYLTAIAIADIAVLLAHIPEYLAQTFSEVSIQSGEVCGITMSLRPISRALAGWYVAALAVDRVTTISLGTKAAVFARKQRRVAVILVCLFAFGWVAGNVYNLWALTFVDGYCDMKPEWRYFKFNINIWILYSMSSFLPIAILFGATVPIIITIWKTPKVQVSGNSSRGLQRATFIVLLVSISYLILTLPGAIFDSMYRFNVIGRNKIVSFSTFYLLYINHSINFLLYVLTGPKFKRELKAMFVEMGCVRLFQRIEILRPTAVSPMVETKDKEDAGTTSTNRTA